MELNISSSTVQFDVLHIASRFQKFSFQVSMYRLTVLSGISG
jgi:hypothetical protein